MSKVKTQFVCQSCGAASPRWAGKCPTCNEWNTLVEERVETAPAARKKSSPGRMGLSGLAGLSAPRPITEVARSACSRLSVGLPEFDRILGGGLVPGAVTLIGGEPGIGKSTLLLQVVGMLATPERRTLYITGEEAAEQVRLRAERLEMLAPNLFVMAETSLEAVFAAIEDINPQAVVVDSIQSIGTEELASSMGSVGQVRECAARLTQFAKARALPIFIVGHVTKTGAVAGPRVLEHIVDTVLYFEGARNGLYRILRAVKNRFGAVDEIGVFEMGERGLVVVENPSQVFLEERPVDTPGSVVTAVMEGSRPLLVEIQALLSANGGFGAPRRSSTGVDARRVALLVAIMEQRLGIHMTQVDVFVNVPGGLHIEETAADLAILAAMVGSLRNQPLAPHWIIVGEVGLAGEVRSVSHFDRRLAEAQRMGFTHCLAGGRAHKQSRRDGIEIIAARDVRQALDMVGF
ncbi:MAG: DNA repair protein RadA [Candidatus Sumerlaeota bacterium]|nr:DNA repair protein RadA [Candidatus Sumerlaeota bacterium]